MLDLGLVDFELGMDMNGGDGDCSEYGYSDMSMGFDVEMECDVSTIVAGTAGGHDIGTGMPTVAMWNITVCKTY